MNGWIQTGFVLTQISSMGFQRIRIRVDMAPKSWMPPPAAKSDLIVFCRFVYKSSRLLHHNLWYAKERWILHCITKHLLGILDSGVALRTSKLCLSVATRLSDSRNTSQMSNKIYWKLIVEGFFSFFLNKTQQSGKNGGATDFEVPKKQKYMPRCSD